MAFNIEMIKKVYDELKTKVDKARELTQSPLTLSEKILYSCKFPVKGCICIKNFLFSLL